METTLNKTELAGALVALGKLIYRRSSKYSTVQIEAKANTIFFRTHTFNKEELEFRMEAEIADNFKTAIDFDTFRSIVRNSRNNKVKFDYSDGKLSFEGVTIVLTEDEWHMTEAPQGDSVATTSLPENFVEMLSAAAPLVDLNALSPILQGMNLSADGLTVTNGKELFNCPHRFNLDDLTIPFPLALMATKAYGGGTLTAWDTGLFTMFSVKLGKWTWTAKALPGNYPNWKSIMSKRSDLKHSVCFTEEHADRLKSFLKSVGDKRSSNEIKISRDAEGFLFLHDGDGHKFGIPAAFDSTWGDFSITVKKEILLHLLNEGHTEIRFGDGMSPFVANGGIGQFIAMPMRHQVPQAEATQEVTQTTVQTEQPAVQPAPGSAVQKSIATTTLNKENHKMESNSIHYTVSAPMQTSAQNHEPELNPLDELLANIESMKAKLKALLDESSVMARKVREVALAQRQKEREYVQTKRTIERIRTASGF